MSNDPYKNKTDEITPERMEEINFVNQIYIKFKESMIAKSELTKKMQKYLDAWKGDYFINNTMPEYKSNEISNFIYSIIETIRPIMVDNNPGFQAMARNPIGIEKSDGVQIAMDYEWDRENMFNKIQTSLITTLVSGTCIFGLFWDGKLGRAGEIKCIPINPLNFYPDPLATNIHDSEYVMYATYKNVYQLKKLFPDKANLLDGGNIKYEELIANRKIDTRVDNQVLILECWMKDYSVEEFEEEKNGIKMKKSKLKYPKGRVVTIAPELNVVLSDRENPYNDGEFPFLIWKDIDIPFEFWGRGEVEQLLSPQKYINDLNNQIIDNAKLTANMPWIIDKNAGIGYGKLTNRPGLVIRKNPGSEIRREQPPSMPAYIGDKVNELKNDIETISGIYDATRGERPVGIQAGNAIIALQEAGQARVRLKVKIMEVFLSELATKWYSRMQQFWIVDRWVRVTGDDGSYDFKMITSNDLKYDFDISISAGSTMPKNKAGMLDLIIRLTQTIAEDGLPILDRKTVLDFVPIAHKKKILEHFENLEQQKQEQALQESQAQELAGMMEELTSSVQEISKEIQNLKQEHERIIQEQKEKNIEDKGYEKGFKNGQGELADDEKLFLEKLNKLNPSEEEVQNALNGQLPDEVIDELEKLSDEELKEVLKQYPQLEELLKNNMEQPLV